ncbi:TPA: hypothetical protein VOO58_000200 [Streptococcus pyogenes]|nr:hypothetical protein [Streptococcus pyogenes]HEQ3954879.1 hypothetical protein [Streptococcus pyogenes]HEQ4000796.1 hypothetical protein [Streptococcus pyogenes]HEQ4050149.1 hypothetical protein [Streptococcus pyogenes]HEQ4109977.1 hypothetical protein [Streptococcus pyogenes]
MRTFSDTPKQFMFTYQCKDYDTARVTSTAILGYITGTYEQNLAEATLNGDSYLEVTYFEDKSINFNLKRICDSFKDYCNQPEDMEGEK